MQYSSVLSFIGRITRAFLIEEVKLMKRMLQQKEKTGKRGKKGKGKKGGKKWDPTSILCLLLRVFL